MLRGWEVAPRLWWWLPPHCQPQHRRFSKSCCDGSNSWALWWMLVDVGISDSCLFLFCCHACSGLFGQCFVVRLGSILIFHSLLLGCLRSVNSNSTSNKPVIAPLCWAYWKNIVHGIISPPMSKGHFAQPALVPRCVPTLPARLQEKTRKTIERQRKSLYKDNIIQLPPHQ